MYVFFDLDRTLLDFESASDTGIKAVFDAYRSDIKMEYDEFSRTWKTIAQNLFDQYQEGKYTFHEQHVFRAKNTFETNGVYLSTEEAEKRFDVYYQAYQKEIRVFPDVIPTLEGLKKAGIPMSVITNGDKGNQHWKLDSKNLSGYFEHVIVSGEEGVAKPDPEICRIALKKAGIDEGSCNPKDIWFIGDSLGHDIPPALELGWNAVFINRKDKVYEVPSGTIEIHDMTEILSMIL